MAGSARAQILKLRKNRGHVRLYLLATVIWVGGTLFYLWGPLPGATIYDGPLGSTVLGCEDVVLGYANCVAHADAIGNLRAAIWRGLIVISIPILLPVLLLMIAAIIDWVADGYKKSTNV